MMIVGLWIAGIVLSLISVIVKVLYKPVQKIADLLLTTFLMLTLFIQLSAIFQTAQRSPFVAAVGIFFFFKYWSYFAPFYPNSDAAGNGMARGFRSIFISIASFIWSVISFLLIKFLTPNGHMTGLFIVLAVATFTGLYNIFANRRSYLTGDAFREKARWVRMSEEDYRKSLARKSMVESNDPWEAEELDAVPEELKHWDVYGCNSIRVTTHSLYPCLLLEGRFEFETESSRIVRTGFCCGSIGRASGEYKDDPVSFVPRNILLVWHDLSERKTYKIQTALPKELNRYFADAGRFRFDNIEFRIMPGGRVLMFHNWFNQIHNIMIDHPLQGEVTDGYEKEVSDLILKDKIDCEKTSCLRAPSSDTINNYQKRFRYQISFCSEDDILKITKTICNFFNGEKILSGGVWKEEMEPSRIKDVFLRFESEQKRYACFVYFDEEEIIKAFDEMITDEVDHAEFTVTVGETPDAFAFGLSCGENCFRIKNAEIRLYKVDETEIGKLVFKNYKGKHKNTLEALAVRKCE